MHRMQDVKVQPDLHIWHGLITLAGRAGQLQRALEVLEIMQDRNCKPTPRTFAALIDACSRAENTDMALKVYQVKPLFAGAGSQCLGLCTVVVDPAPGLLVLELNPVYTHRDIGIRNSRPSGDAAPDLCARPQYGKHTWVETSWTVMRSRELVVW